ncbi:MAG: ATP-grasp domain-containing protein [Deltaproteobacteria bacterium]|nr:ATP-grasp domain-containing protein [Deltaproteobacteria bacterium]
MKVLITSARTPHALNAIRQFGESGCTVIAADCTRLAPGLYSRFAAERRITPPMTERPREWADWLRAELRGGGYDLVFPCFEEIFVVAAIAGELREFTSLVVPDFETMMRVHDKTRLADTMRALAIAVPETAQPQSDDELRELAGGLPYPAIIKMPDANNSLGLAVVNGPDELIETYARTIRFLNVPPHRRPVVQPKIEGRLVYTLGLADRGTLAAFLAYRPLMSFPDTGGTAFYRETTIEPAAERLAERFVSGLGWHGFIGMDVILDRDEKAWLIDANPRPTPAYQTGRAAGVDFTSIYLDIAGGRRSGSRPAARAGVRTKTLFVELIWFFMLLLPGRGWLARARRALTFFTPKPHIPDIHRADDPWPSVAMSIFVPWFMFIITPVKKENAGFCYSCNFTGETRRKLLGA